MGWNIIRDNHARQPQSSSPLFGLKIKHFFYFFGILKHLYTLRSEDSAKSFEIFRGIPLATGMYK